MAAQFFYHEQQQLWSHIPSKTFKYKFNPFKKYDSRVCRILIVLSLKLDFTDLIVFDSILYSQCLSVVRNAQCSFHIHSIFTVYPFVSFELWWISFSFLQFSPVRIPGLNGLHQCSNKHEHEHAFIYFVTKYDTFSNTPLTLRHLERWIFVWWTVIQNVPTFKTLFNSTNPNQHSTIRFTRRFPNRSQTWELR